MPVEHPKCQSCGASCASTTGGGLWCCECGLEQPPPGSPVLTFDPFPGMTGKEAAAAVMAWANPTFEQVIAGFDATDAVLQADAACECALTEGDICGPCESGLD